MGTWGLGQDTLEVRVIRRAAWCWEAPVDIELVAMLSIQDPPGATGRVEWGRGSLERAVGRENGLSWGGVHLLLARQ